MGQVLFSRRLFATIVGTLALVFLSVACQQNTVLLPRELPDGTQGEFYQVYFSLKGQESPVNSFRVVEGRLPDGLDLLPTTKADSRENRQLRIEGTPTEPGTFTFSVAVSTFGTQQHGISLRQQYRLAIQPTNSE